MQETFLVRGPVHLYNISIGRLLNKQTPEHVEWEAAGGDDQEGLDETEATLKSALPANANGESRKRKSKARA